MCELLGAALDAAVCEALSIEPRDPRAPLLHEHFGFCMNLQADHDIAVYPDPEVPAGGLDKWVAGFNLRAERDCDTWSDFGDVLGLDHSAVGPTPAIAICRAIVQRHLDAAKLAQEQAEREARAAAAEVECERLEQVRAAAWHRAEQARMHRTPFTEFEDDEARRAYGAAMDDQLALVRRQNDKTYGGKA